MARLFTAINLPSNIKEKLVSYYQEELPAKWVRKDNLHITLDFLGYVRDDKIPEIIKEQEQKIKNIYPFYIKLNKICFAPPEKKVPKMVWAAGRADSEFYKLANNLHVTLARIRKWDFQRYGYQVDVERDINLRFFAQSLDVMESKLKKGGPEYITLQRILLKQ